MSETSSDVALMEAVLNMENDEVIEVKQYSDDFHAAHSAEKSEHYARLKDRLDVNKLVMIDIPEDGDCFFRSLEMLMPTKVRHEEIRTSLLEEITTDTSGVYQGFNTCIDPQMLFPGHWNSDMGDLFPTAAANFLKANIVIHSSHKDRHAPYIISPTIPGVKATFEITLAHLAINGHEHYNPCIPEKSVFIARVDQCGQIFNSIESIHEESLDVPVPIAKRRKISYRQFEKQMRNTGQEYVTNSGKLVRNKQPQNAICRCNNQCQTLTLVEKEKKYAKNMGS